MKKFLLLLFVFFSCASFRNKPNEVIYRVHSMETLYLSTVCKIWLMNEANLTIHVYVTVDECKEYVKYLGKEVKIQIVDKETKK